MKIHIMGSAAADGWPAVWCGCTPCKRARAAGGKSIRSRSGAIVDDVIKLDLCPDTYMQAVRDNIDLSLVTDLLVTHSHADHLCAAELSFHRPPFAHQNATMHVWAGQKSIEQVHARVGNWPDREERLHVLEPYKAATLTDGTYVMPLAAAHDPNSNPLNYIIRRNGKTLLYGMDSGWYPEESWNAHVGHLFDVVIIDCTLGDPDRTWYGHGTIKEAIKAKEKMLTAGTANKNTIFVVNHFSHNGAMLHEELEERLNGTGILVGYDGMTIEV